MGSPGFFGLLLGKRGRRRREWLLCTLWGADNWMLVNGRWLAAHPDQYALQRPLVGAASRRTEEGHSVPTGEQWDEFRPMVIDQPITRFSCRERACEIVIGSCTLEIQQDHASRPIFCGNKEPRALKADEDLRTAWVLARTNYFFY